MPKNPRQTDSVAVIGLGRFGASVAAELMQEGTEVLGIDSDLRLVESLSGQLTQTVAADSTNDEALRQLAVHEFDRAVLGIGSNLEASILTASVLLGFGIPNIWAKAISEPHARILTQLGVQHVVRPEHDMGRRVAHLVGGRMLEYVEFDPGFAMAKTNPPAAASSASPSPTPKSAANTASPSSQSRNRTGRSPTPPRKPSSSRATSSSSPAPPPRLSTSANWSSPQSGDQPPRQVGLNMPAGLGTVRSSVHS